MSKNNQTGFEKKSNKISKSFAQIKIDAIFAIAILKRHIEIHNIPGPVVQFG